MFLYKSLKSTAKWIVDKEMADDQLLCGRIDLTRLILVLYAKTALLQVVLNSFFFSCSWEQRWVQYGAKQTKWQQ